MLNNSLYFIHAFDAKMHFAIYHSLLEIEENSNISLHDSTSQVNDNPEKGRWKFIADGKDYSDGVYHTLEIIRKNFFSEVEGNEKKIGITLVPMKGNSDICYVLKDSQELENQDSKDDVKISKQIFFKVIQPVLEEMCKKTGHHISLKILNTKQLIPKSNATNLSFD